MDALKCTWNSFPNFCPFTTSQVYYVILNKYIYIYINRLLQADGENDHKQSFPT